MCIPATIPSGWQQTCLKTSGRVPHNSPHCSLFCSPNGKTFKTLDEVHKYNCELERIKLEKQEFLGKNTYSFVPNQTGNNYQFVKTSSQSKKENVQSFNNNQRDETVSCQQCKFQFTTAKERLAHMTLHSQQAFATITCKKCQKVFQSIASLEEHLKRDHAGPPGPPIQMGKSPSALDMRLQNYSKNSNSTDKFNKVFQSNNKAENILNNITGLSVTKNTRSNVPNARAMSSEEAKAELRRRYIDACESVEREKRQSTPALPPGPAIVKPVNVKNTANLVAVTPPFSLPSPPGPALQPKVAPKIPISGAEMLRAMEQEAAKKKTRTSQQKAASPSSLPPAKPVKTEVKHLVFKAPKSPLHKIKTGKVAKKKEVKVPVAGVWYAKNSFNKFKVSVNQVCRFFNMVDYPLPITDKMRERFQDFSSFERFYSPLLVSVNPVSDPLKIKTLCRAKFREAITSGSRAEQSQQSPSLYNNRPNTFG